MLSQGGWRESLGKPRNKLNKFKLDPVGNTFHKCILQSLKGLFSNSLYKTGIYFSPFPVKVHKLCHNRKNGQMVRNQHNSSAIHGARVEFLFSCIANFKVLQKDMGH
jgi:hypothetical protein